MQRGHCRSFAAVLLCGGDAPPARKCGGGAQPDRGRRTSCGRDARSASASTSTVWRGAGARRRGGEEVDGVGHRRQLHQGANRRSSEQSLREPSESSGTLQTSTNPFKFRDLRTAAECWTGSLCYFTEYGNAKAKSLINNRCSCCDGVEDALSEAPAHTPRHRSREEPRYDQATSRFTGSRSPLE